MNMQVQDSKDTSIIFIDGDRLLGIDNEIFQKLVKDSIERGSKNISVDLSNVRFISSWGIEGFLHAYTLCKNKNVNFNLKNVNVTIKNVFSTLKLTDIIKII